MAQEHTEANTEEKILAAARSVFMAKGLDGARMQDIADTAGINKALLHYYFRSKEKLFQKVFVEKGRETGKIFREVIGLDIPVRDKLLMLIDKECDKLDEDPMMLFFVISEMRRNPDVVMEASERDVAKIQFKKLFKQIKEEIANGTIRKDVNPEDVMIDIMSLMHFPRMAAPLVTEMFFDGNEEAFKKNLKRRIEHIKNVILKNLEP